ncbi:2-octaprenyl-6-methoxyphenyl hydroxylase [Pseudolysobacter antarcticus]|uniref:2-octaprenyl-6-methoxyphenyl hydroxylase n=2 Tax=Pseudolysobacter antarcticus TaxID=2511995 RepID=A0A411HQ10_9GAMM|nr:2-octaprenyl-6-methoxyphenyl hydroxylase [Pseudolysobacter antarcticus]QBB72583.1 2-octaprenyl-6-methoxyphenyl hydroxylase [Pseudolysobacter antarcticus]
MTSEKQNYDVVIVGGGLVGASLAIALDGAGWSVAQVEAVSSKADHQPSYDERNLALARASVNALSALGVWSFIGTTATPIKRIHITRRGEFGAVRLNAAEHDVADFGAVIPARELGNALLARLQQCVTLERICPASVTAIETNAVRIELQIKTAEGTRQLATRLLVGADGSDSFVRKSLGIAVDHHDYAQTAFVSTLTPERAMDGCAYERFTDSGPVALLPLSERRAGLVMTVPSEEAGVIAELDDTHFLDLVQQRFGYRLGRLARIGKRVNYPLRRTQAQSVTASRTVLVGNAAQTVHPIGAQGFNLGLRDALTLAELLIAARRDDADPGAATLLAQYAARRESDRSGVIAFSDGLVRFFGNEFLPLRVLRSLGMLALDRIAPLKQILALRGMGFRGEVPLLSRGIDPRDHDQQASDVHGIAP